MFYWRDFRLSLIFFVNLVFSILEFLIVLRLLFRFFGANSAAPFVNWLYETTNPLVAPFLGIFPNPRLEGTFVLEIASLFALIAYAFLEYILRQLIVWVSRPPITG